MKSNYQHIFTPLTVKNMTIKNRIVMMPMGTNYGEQNGIYDIIAQSMERHTVIRNPELEEILAVEDETYKWIESRW